MTDRYSAAGDFLPAEVVAVATAALQDRYAVIVFRDGGPVRASERRLPEELVLRIRLLLTAQPDAPRKLYFPGQSVRGRPRQSITAKRRAALYLWERGVTLQAAADALGVRVEKLKMWGGRKRRGRQPDALIPATTEPQWLEVGARAVARAPASSQDKAVRIARAGAAVELLAASEEHQPLVGSLLGEG